MNFVNYVLQNPIYTLLFGSGGILIVIISIIQLVKKRRKKSNQQPEKKINHHRNPYENSNTSVYDKEKSKSAVDNEKQNAVSFVSELIYNSPVEDKITLKQIDINKKEFD